MSNDRPPRSEGLTTSGAARRDEILGVLHRRLDARIRRRRIVRASAVSAAMVALAGVVAVSLMGRPVGGAQPRSEAIAHTQSEVEITRNSNPSPVEVVRAEAGRVTVRIASTPVINAAPCESDPSAGVCLLSDEQLLAALAEAGQPSGLVRMGDRTIIVPRNQGTQQSPWPRGLD